MKKKDKRYFLNICRQLDWEFIQGKTHYKLKHPDGQSVTISGSSSCPYYKSHVIQDIKRLLRQKGHSDDEINKIAIWRDN